MIKTEERERKSGWYVYVFIGVVIGAALGYAAASQGWLGNEAVGLAPSGWGGVGTCTRQCGTVTSGYGINGVGCTDGCNCLARQYESGSSKGVAYNTCWGYA